MGFYKDDSFHGLHSGTRFYDYYEGRYRTEYHKEPDTGRLVILQSWYVDAGDGDVMPEFEVIGIYPPVACMLAEMNAPYMIKGKMPQISHA